MFRFYSPIFLLQVFCFYHIYANNRDFKWYILVAFVPFLGSILYLYLYYVHGRNLGAITDAVKDTFVPNGHLKKLHAAVEFSDTVNNRLTLANAYLEEGMAERAIHHYERCLEGVYDKDPEILSKLLQAHYLMDNYQEVVEIGKTIEGNQEFEKSREKIAYAASLGLTGNADTAEKVFESMNVKYANYLHRLEYAKYLDYRGKVDESNDLLAELMSEIGQMDSYERRMNRD
ncbi:hypothetical protein N9B82_06275, partial [Saprospiraceae bacterium]|nr:hypothetical protein [Saprospiraceae bacterium]